MAGAPSVQVRAEAGEHVVESSGYYEQLFISELHTIDATTTLVARQHRLSADETDELKSLVHFKIITDDYAILRKFEGRSSLRTYLTIVIRRILLDARSVAWGRWRPSAEARRAGPVATLLERLMHCHGLSFDQACTEIETVHGIEADRAVLEKIYQRLPPVRPRRHLVGEEALESVPCAARDSEDIVAGQDRRRVASHAAQLLAAELALLPADDQQILRLRFVDGLTVRDIGRMLSVTVSTESKALYRRLQHLLMTLRFRLEEQGLLRADVLDLMGDDEVTVPRVLALPPGGRRASG